jgi:putative oxidoreductase
LYSRAPPRISFIFFQTNFLKKEDTAMLIRMLKLLRTVDDRMLFVVRLVLGSVMFAHGAQKALGWFGGPGLRPTIDFFGQNLGIPAPLALLAIAAEFLGGAGLILGLLGRASAIGIAVNMIVAALMVHLPNGFFMNWFGAKQGEGIEYHLLALALASLIVVRGSGAWSLDQFIFEKFHHFIDRGASHGEGSVTLAPGMPRPVAGPPAMMRASWTWVAMALERRW